MNTHEPDPHSRQRQATHIAIAIVIVVLAMVAATLMAKYEMVPWITVLFVAGTVGGVVNNFNRIQKLPTATIRKPSVMVERLVTIQIYVSPFVGGVFAMVLYTMFMCGFVQGSLFPSFQDVNDPFTSFADFAAFTDPATNVDCAKALLWAFIAGFSEGLVPNFISKIAKDAGKDGAAKETA
ncbi:MAG: hypothetical protein HY301_05140 [Verrucomicrobia bacterium]|nr:hypothetical protein [Verrucomicrobiota bacterium]